VVRSCLRCAGPASSPSPRLGTHRARGRGRPSPGPAAVPRSPADSDDIPRRSGLAPLTPRRAGTTMRRITRGTPMTSAIAGGSGGVGRHAVRAAQAQGHGVVVLSRSECTVVLSGAVLEERLVGVDAVIYALNTTSLSRRKSTEFFRATSRHLLEAGARHGVAHHVVLSIVGIDGIRSEERRVGKEGGAARGAGPAERNQ